MNDSKTLAARHTPRETRTVNLDRQMCSLRFSPCGKILAAGGSDATVRRWQLEGNNLTPLPVLTGHGGWVSTLAFHPDGKSLLTADSWGRLSCWPFLENQPRPVWSLEQAHASWIRALVISPDGKTLATAGTDRIIRLWDPSGKKLRELNAGDDVLALAFAPSGTALVSGDLHGRVRHWDLASGKAVRELDAKTLYLLSRLQDVGGVRVLAFDAAGKTLACAGTQPSVGGNVQGVPAVLLFDWATGKLTRTLTPGKSGDGYVFDLHWHPAGFWMGVTSGNPGSGRLFFQTPQASEPFFVTTKMANCHALAVHPGGKRLVVSATNRDSAGNGRLLKGKDYPGNYSPLVVWDMPG